MLRAILPYAVLAGLGLIFFLPLLIHPASILYSDHSDFIVQYLPSRHFLTASWRTDGELPLWCPYALAGMPFLHDPQVAAFYPPNAILYFLPDAAIGPAMSWLIVAHVIIAGWGAYTYGRSQGLNLLPALATGIGYTFAGKWMLHLLGGGHFTFAPIAWLPWVLLLMEQALRRAGSGQRLAALFCAMWGGAIFGVLCLGAQPQLSFYSGLFLAVWLLGPALESAGGKRGAALLRWAGLGGWAALWAVGLFAVQLLPTVEAAKETTRAVSGAVPDPPQTVLRTLVSLIGPSLAGEGWDYQGGFGLLWVIAAVLAPILVPRRLRFQAGVTLALVLFAIGGPFLERLPLFNLFRIPPRMFLIAALPISLFAGMTTQALFCTSIASATAARCRRIATAIGGLLLLLVGLQALLLALSRQSLQFHPYWGALAVLILASVWLARKLAAPAPIGWRVAWVAVLLLDLWALAFPLVAVRPEAELDQPTASVDYLMRHPEQHGRVLDRDAPSDPKAPSLEHASKGNSPLGYAQPMLRRIEAVRGLNPIDVYRYKKYLQFIADEDKPIEASGGIENFPIRNRNLLDLLGTRYLLQPAAIKPEGDDWSKVERDADPVAFGLIAGGMQRLPPYTLYKNGSVFPRAFVVPDAAPLPATGSLLRVMKETDFHRVVLLEGTPAISRDGPSDAARLPVDIVDYRPNRVALDLHGGPGGYLVLTDVWFPGWTATVDGQPAEVARADYVFRAVRVPDGAREVVFQFAPESYRRGRLISMVTVALLAVLTLAAAVVFGRRRRPACG